MSAKERRRRKEYENLSRRYLEVLSGELPSVRREALLKSLREGGLALARYLAIPPDEHERKFPNKLPDDYEHPEPELGGISL